MTEIQIGERNEMYTPDGELYQHPPQVGDDILMGIMWGMVIFTGLMMFVMEIILQKANKK